MFLRLRRRLFRPAGCRYAIQIFAFFQPFSFGFFHTAAAFLAGRRQAFNIFIAISAGFRRQIADSRSFSRGLR